MEGVQTHYTKGEKQLYRNVTVERQDKPPSISTTISSSRLYTVSWFDFMEVTASALEWIN